MKKADVFSNKSEFNGQHAIMAYNKTSQKTGKTNEIRDIKEWIMAVGKHQGIINSSEWIKVQTILEQNKSKSYRKARSNTALLSGLLYCGNCRSFMRPKLSQRKNKDGELIYDYLCELKEKSKCEKCSMKRPNGNKLDKMVCKEIKKLTENKQEFISIIKNELNNFNIYEESNQDKTKYLKKSMKDIEIKIKALVQSLSQTKETAAEHYILQEINELDEKKQLLQNQIQEIENINENGALTDTDLENLTDILISFSKSFDCMALNQKRTAIRTFIYKIIWDGADIHIYFFDSDKSLTPKAAG